MIYGRAFVLIIAALAFLTCLVLLLDSDLFVATSKQEEKQTNVTTAGTSQAHLDHRRNDLLEIRYSNFSTEFRAIVKYWGYKGWTHAQSGNNQSERIIPIKVTSRDLDLGHSFKTYMYPLPDEFHRGAWEAQMFNITADCLDQECTWEQIKGSWPRSMDHEAEVVILRKFVASLNFVQDPHDADLFLVPALPATVTNHRFDHSGCLVYGECKTPWFERLIQQLHYIDDIRRPHLFLATQDSDFNHKIIKDLVIRKSNCYMISYGSGDVSETLVVPSVDVDPRRQPMHFNASRPLLSHQRPIFVMANFGIRHKDRTRMATQLAQYNGSKVIYAPQNAQLQHGHWDHMDATTPYHGDAIFVLCPPGDRPFTKRMYDTWSAVAIPVVIKTKCGHETATHWRKCTNREPPFWPAFVHKTYPRIIMKDGSLLNYSNILVEVDRDEFEKNNIVEVLESIPTSKIDELLLRIETLRHHFVYDLHGVMPDAFTDLLQNVQKLTTTTNNFTSS